MHSIRASICRYAPVTRGPGRNRLESGPEFAQPLEGIDTLGCLFDGGE